MLGEFGCHGACGTRTQHLIASPFEGFWIIRDGLCCKLVGEFWKAGSLGGLGDWAVQIAYDPGADAASWYALRGFLLGLFGYSNPANIYTASNNQPDYTTGFVGYLTTATPDGTAVADNSSDGVLVAPSQAQPRTPSQAPKRSRPLAPAPSGDRSVAPARGPSVAFALGPAISASPNAPLTQPQPAGI